jgi:hypothetical protein
MPDFCDISAELTGCVLETWLERLLTCLEMLYGPTHVYVCVCVCVHVC